ncbi:MAG: FeoB-associated Cys-rich membrane protein [Clostridia bacterium]|nr:FeoB-associated Cys-rich membrane protein [Clostridia bacterium]
MLNWLITNLSTLIVSAVLLVIIVAIIVSKVKNKKKGNSSCGCGCVNCAMKDTCHRSE